MIYKNPLGQPDAKANISMFGGTFCPAYYAMHTTSDAPAHKWDGTTPPQQIITEMEAEGWRCTLARDGRSNPVIYCTHIETQRVIDAVKAEQDQKFVGAERGYIRFGELPEGGRSRNYRDDKLEAGVSCFEAEIAADGSFRLLLTPILQVSYLTVSMRQPYRLYGEVIGSGADGEPLLRVSRSAKL